MRVFKTASFARAARKALISDAELRDAAREAAAGQATDLGGGVLKKRLHRNQHRSIILARGGRLWIYAYLFAKKDTANISASELECSGCWPRAMRRLRRSNSPAS